MFPIMGATNPTGYNLTRSLRFRASASAYLSRTPASAGNRQVYTWSGWIKRGILSSSTRYTFFESSSGGATNFTSFSFDSDNIRLLSYDAGAKKLDRTSTPVYRDPSSWYHVVIAVDMTQVTATNRQRVYVNGVEITAWTNTTTLSQNSDTWINYNQAHYIARDVDVSTYFDGYLAEINFIDGQALTPSSFGSTNTLTGVWQPAKYGGTYGTNGFYLPFTDNSALTTSSNVGLGKDFSGNGNYWTTNNISITSGTTYDSMTDVPTLTSPTVANFAVINPIFPSAGNRTLTNGNLTFTNNAGSLDQSYSTFKTPSSGKFYFEATITNIGFGGTSTYLGLSDNTFYDASGRIFVNNISVATVATYTTNDIISMAFDVAVGTVQFFKNNTSVYSGTGVSLRDLYVYMNGYSGCVLNFNFGQRPFSYTPPTGYVALNTYNLPTSTILKGNTVMDATLWTGNGATQSIVNAAPFRPDLVWLKIRSASGSHRLLDSVRGATNALSSNLTNAEFVDSTGLTAFNSNGFTLGADGSYNGSGSTYVGWQWQAGQGTTSTNTNGSITSTVSVNASAGFSIVSYTGTGANATVGHGLGVAPKLIITKNRSATSAWHTYVAAIPNMQNGYIVLNTSDAFSTSTNTVWNGTQPTSTVFSVGTDTGPNGSGNSIIAYCFTPIAGYSAFGSYTGNGSTDGPFVYTGFLPRWVLVKNTYSTGNWDLYDTARNPYNAMDLELFPNSSSAEYNGGRYFDFLSNGFKPRTTVSDINASGGTYIYMAFATNPFKNALAR